MFSIEKTLQEIIDFFKKIYLTTFAILFRPLRALEIKRKPSFLLNPSLYMLIAVIIYLSFVRLDLGIIDENLDQIILRYFNFFREGDLSKSILYVILMGILVRLVILLFAKLLLLKRDELKAFKKISFYWIGATLIFIVLSDWILLALLLSSEFQWNYGIIRLVTPYIPAMLFFSKLLRSYRMARSNLSYKYLVIGIFVISTSPLFKISLAQLIEYSDLKPAKVLEIYGSTFTKRINMNVSKHNANSTLTFSCLLILKNQGPEPVLIDKQEHLYFKSYQDTNDVIDGDFGITLLIAKIDQDSISESKIVKPNETVALYCRGNATIEDWNGFLSNTTKTTLSSYRITLQYFPTSPDKSASVSEVIELVVPVNDP